MHDTFTRARMEAIVGDFSESVWRYFLGQRLHEYAAHNETDLVSRLAGAGARNFRVLNAATAAGHEGMVVLLLAHGFARKGSRVDDDEGNTPLHAAVTHDRRSIARVLLRHGGIDKNAKNRRGLTALFMAARAGRYGMVLDLLAHGADPDVPCGSRDRTTLHVRAVYRDRRMMLALLQSGASVHATMQGGLTALHLAAFSLDAATVRTLIENWAVVDAVSDTGRTPLHLASATTGRKPGVCGGAVEVVRTLLEEGADQRSRDEKGEAPVDVAGAWCQDGQREGEGVSGVIKSVSLMLVHADADRAWRRRGWLVMSRAKHETGVGGVAGVVGVVGWALSRSGAPEDVFRHVVAFL